MTEFRKKYQNFPIDFHLWSQDKIAELWWKLALEWAKNMAHLYAKDSELEDIFSEELEE